MDYVEDRFSSHRIAGIAFVALLHVVIIYALVSGLGEQFVQVLHKPLEARIIQEVKPPPPPPPPPPVPQLLQPPPPFIPPPLLQIAPPPPPVPVIAQVTHVAPPAPPPKPVPQQPAIRSAARLDPNQSCDAENPTEDDDIVLTGRTVLQFLIGADGSVLSSRVAVSSGHEVLDRAALTAVSHCKFDPAIGADGKPQETWTTQGYDFQAD